MTGAEKTSGKILMTAVGILFAALLLLLTPAAAAGTGDQVITSELTLSLCEITVTADTGIRYTIDGQQVSSILVLKGGCAQVRITAMPARSTLKTKISPGAEMIVDGSTITVQDVTAEKVTLTLKAVKHPSPPGGGGGGGRGGILIEDVTGKYDGLPLFAATDENLTAILNASPAYTQELAAKFAAAEQAGYKLINTRGTPVVDILKYSVPHVILEKFSIVYEITQLNAGEKISQVEIPVPMTVITESGLPREDVHIYHCTKEVDLWIPLEILGVTFDEENYYFTAETDGVSPFGVLIKHFGPPESGKETLPHPTPKRPVPVLKILAVLFTGLAAATAVRAARNRK